MLDFIKKHAKLLLTITIPIVGLFAFSIIQNFNVFKNDGNVTVIIGGTNVINHTLPTTSDDKKVASWDFFIVLKTPLTRSIPFRIQAADPFYSEKNQAYLMESIRELDAGLGQEHELIKTDDASNR